MHLLYSLSKSFTSAAAGFAVAEGLLDLDASVLSYFPELDAAVADPRSRAMRVRDVAAMASGHLAETIDEAFAGADPMLGFLTIPPDRDPGTVFAYNQPCTYSLAAIVQRLTGGTLTAGTRLRLTDASGLGGITGATLGRDATGWTLELDAWDGHAVASVGSGCWAVTAPDDGSAPLAVSVGTTGPGRVRADVLLLETPHRLHLDGDLPAGTLTATWATEPLGGVSLRSMAPR